MSREFKEPLGPEEIEAVIPHRNPFRFLDSIIEFEDRVRATGTYQVTGKEALFEGHFPGRPIFPGVIMLEALAQLGVFFARYATGGTPKEKLIVFTGADDVKFRRAVHPGDQLTISMNEWKRKGPFWKLS
jgi:3-hydroxymyristoyl/3-hydroxydecanoyl-(acyl carrier protein) dehydratase